MPWVKTEGGFSFWVEPAAKVRNENDDSDSSEAEYEGVIVKDESKTDDAMPSRAVLAETELREVIEAMQKDMVPRVPPEDSTLTDLLPGSPTYRKWATLFESLALRALNRHVLPAFDVDGKPKACPPHRKFTPPIVDVKIPGNLGETLEIIFKRGKRARSNASVPIPLRLHDCVQLRPDIKYRGEVIKRWIRSIDLRIKFAQAAVNQPQMDWNPDQIVQAAALQDYMACLDWSSDEDIIMCRVRNDLTFLYVPNRRRARHQSQLKEQNSRAQMIDQLLKHAEDMYTKAHELGIHHFAATALMDVYEGDPYKQNSSHALLYQFSPGTRKWLLTAAATCTDLPDSLYVDYVGNTFAAHGADLPKVGVARPATILMGLVFSMARNVHEKNIIILENAGGESGRRAYFTAAVASNFTPFCVRGDDAREPLLPIHPSDVKTANRFENEWNVFWTPPSYEPPKYKASFFQ